MKKISIYSKKLLSTNKKRIYAFYIRNGIEFARIGLHEHLDYIMNFEIARELKSIQDAAIDHSNKCQCTLYATVNVLSAVNASCGSNIHVTLHCPYIVYIIRPNCVRW